MIPKTRLRNRTAVSRKKPKPPFQMGASKSRKPVSRKTQKKPALSNTEIQTAVKNIAFSRTQKKGAELKKKGITKEMLERPPNKFTAFDLIKQFGFTLKDLQDLGWTEWELSNVSRQLKAKK